MALGGSVLITGGLDALGDSALLALAWANIASFDNFWGSCLGELTDPSGLGISVLEATEDEACDV